MTIRIIDFLSQLRSNIPLIFTTLLTLGVILVNGWTDAPNAIATCVSTRSLSPKHAIIMAAIFNFLGVLFMTMVNYSVAKTLFNMVDFGNNSYNALVALCAGLFAIVVWATAAWLFGIPTSESHALIAGVTGAAYALQGAKGINTDEWNKVLYGLIMSTILGFSAGYLVTKTIGLICKSMDRQKTNPFFQKAQILGSGAMAFMHGAQDGQKFMGIFILGIFLAQGQGDIDNFKIPIWMMILCSLIMALGTSLGGYRIIKTVGMEMVKLDRYQGFSADIAAAFSLFMASILGIPVSTTHTKTTAIMGVGASKRITNVNWIVVKDMVLAWILTFPGCGLMGYLMAFLFMKLFNT